MKKIKIKNLLQALQGVQTIDSIMSILNINRQKAIYYAHRLRKQGYVKTKRTNKNKRVFYISFENKLKGESPIDVINKHSPTKIVSSEDYRVYGKPLSLEESLIYAIKSKNLRLIIASLSLFKKIRNWPVLYKLAKANNIKRQAGALYDIARKKIRVRKMPKRFRKNVLPKKNERYEFIITGLKSMDFKKIEKLWRVYIPLNEKDLEGIIN